MELYKVPRNKYVRLLEDEKGPPYAREVKAGEVVWFRHIDGFYSYCVDSDNKIVYLPATAEVEVVNDQKEDL